MISKVAVVTDSTACIPEKLANEYGIQQVPLLLSLDDTTYRDKVDIKSPGELFEMMKKARSFPTTSAPTPGQYAEVYRKLSEQTDKILNITISSVLSMSFGSAVQARDLVKSELPGINIEILDSRLSVGAQGLIALGAARAAASGKDMTAVVDVAESIKAKINMLDIFDTLSYLARSGRISWAVAMAGNMISMKPITEMTVEMGRATVIARPRTRKRAIQALLEIVKARVTKDKPVQFLVEHTCVPDEAERLKETVQEQFNCGEVLLGEYSPLSSVITGPGLLGLVFYQE